MSKSMRRTLWVTLAVLSVGSMALVTWQWRQQREAIKARIPKIDRSAKERNQVDPASPLPDPTFSPKKAKEIPLDGAADVRGVGRQ